MASWPPTLSYWRRGARHYCGKVLEAWQSLPDDERTEQRLRVMLRDAYPFGARAHHPYQMWLKEQRIALYSAGFGPRPPELDAKGNKIRQAEARSHTLADAGVQRRLDLS